VSDPEKILTADWERLLLVWLLDPFDKALDFQGHEVRAARYASAALGREVSSGEIQELAVSIGRHAEIAERAPAVIADHDGASGVGPQDGTLLLHPMSAAEYSFSACEIDVAAGVKTFTELTDGLSGARERFFAVWRMLPDQIACEFGSDMARLPADTRFPDHTLIQHADVTTGQHAALSGQHGAAFLSFAIGPVKSFIAAARSVRDLWSGSAILSWLIFQAMRPVIESLGPTAMIYPSLRGSPLLDLWLRREVGLNKQIPEPCRVARRAPSLPNRFVALVPWGKEGENAEKLRQACLGAVREGWCRLSSSVREKLESSLATVDRDWATLWDDQIETAFEFRAVAMPERAMGDDELARLVGQRDFASAWPYAEAVRGLARALPASDRPRYGWESAGRWQAQMEVSARLMAAERAVRHFPASTGSDAARWPGKCTLFGSWEQMGPAAFDASRSFWARAASSVSVDGVRIRPGERFSAVALTKRFAGPALLASELNLTLDDLRFPDTATVAAAEWLEGAGIDPDQERRSGHWSGQWLHWRRQDQDEDEPRVPNDLWKRINVERGRARQGPPPSYYAVISMDGDKLGRWLAGEKTPEFRRLLHPKLRAHLEGLADPVVERGLCARQPVGPALHTAISAALAAFATEVAPEIVKLHKGVTIYSGGDDVLALCPVSNALACASALRAAFSGTDDPAHGGWRAVGNGHRITMGTDATMSAGLVVAHLREDLRLVFAEARAAEKRAKSAGRDRLDLVAMRGSGETVHALCPWDFVGEINSLRLRFAAGLSTSWIYNLRTVVPTLASGVIPRPAMRAEIRRLVDRMDEAGSGGASAFAGEMAAEMFDRYCDTSASVSTPNLLCEFTTLCQSAAFMARGRDD